MRHPSKCTQIYDHFNRKRMPFESISQSHGLPDEKARHMLQLKVESVPHLEVLTADVVLKVICKDGMSKERLAVLPNSVLKTIIKRLMHRGIPCPEILDAFLQLPTRSLDLSNCMSSRSIPCITVSLFSILRTQTGLHTLILDNNAFLTDNLLILLKDIKTLQILSLSGCHRLTNSLFVQIKQLTNLKSLSVSKINKVTTAGLLKLWNGADSLLESIDLSYTGVEEEESRNIFKALLPFLRLTSLTLDGVAKLKNLNYLEGLQNLKYLSLSYTSLTSAAVSQQICKLNRLEELYMYKVKIPPTNINSLLELPLLKSLNLSFEGWTNGSINANTSLRFNSVSMTSLLLANTPWLTDHIFSQLTRNLRGLLELDISNSRVSSHCLSLELYNLSQLKVLGLQGLSLHDEDMTAISNLSRLIKLNVSDTRLSDKFLISGHLNGCEKLQLLSMCRCNISDRGLSSLRLKDLSTLWLDGCNSISIEVALVLSSSNCPKLTYLSLRNLRPAVNNEDEVQVADVIDLDEL